MSVEASSRASPVSASCTPHRPIFTRAARVTAGSAGCSSADWLTADRLTAAWFSAARRAPDPVQPAPGAEVGDQRM
jgi:hypothetical protein